MTGAVLVLIVLFTLFLAVDSVATRDSSASMRTSDVEEPAAQ